MMMAPPPDQGEAGPSNEEGCEGNKLLHQSTRRFLIYHRMDKFDRSVIIGTNFVGRNFREIVLFSSLELLENGRNPTSHCPFLNQYKNPDIVCCFRRRRWWFQRQRQYGS